MSANEDSRGPVESTTAKRKRGPGDSAAGGTVGNALRSVYDETVSEAIPDDLLDLLGKLS